MSAALDIAKSPDYWWVAPIAARHRAVVPCGCAVYVGLRVDLDEPEPASGAMPCTEAHEPLIAEFNRRLIESLESPRPDPLVVVCAELLGQVYDERIESGDAGKEEVQEVREGQVEDGDA